MILFKHNRLFGRQTFTAKVLDGAAAVGNGEWISAEGFRNMSLQVSGTFTATVQVRGSNEEAKPADTSHGEAIGSDISAAGITKIDTPVKWIKVRVSAYTSGSVNAWLHGTH